MRPSTIGCPSSRSAGHEIESVDVSLLANAVDTPEPLFKPGRVPGQVVIDHQPAELEVDPLAGRLGRDADLLLGAELLLGASSVRAGSSRHESGRWSIPSGSAIRRGT